MPSTRPLAPLCPNPVRSLAPPPDRRMSLLVSCLAYGLIVLGVRAAMDANAKAKARPQANQASQRIFVLDFSQIKEQPLERPASPRPPKEGEENAGGGGDPRLSSETVAPEALKIDPAAMVLDETPSMLPTEPMAATGSGTGAKGAGGGTGSGGGTGPGIGSGDGAGFKAALPLNGDDVEVEERYKPDYPLMAELRRIEGRVHVGLEVNDKGVPTRVWIVDGDPVFHSNVLSTFKRYRFKNLKKRGIPTPATIQIEVWFHFPTR